MEEISGELRYIILNVVDADPDVVEPVVGEERLGLLDDVAGNTAALVQEEVEATLLLFGQIILFAAEVIAVEGRVTGDDGSLEGGDGSIGVGGLCGGA